jgi:glycosyltransferase involved in cell wall biosynthesis
MKVAYITSSNIPSMAANSIQVMKVCQSLAQVGSEVCLFAPRSPNHPHPAWEDLSKFYGLSQPFAIQWLPSAARWKRYDFTWNAVRAARSWGAQAIYTRMPQAALLSLWRKVPMLLELHDRPSGKIGPWIMSRILRHRGKKRLLFITQALLSAIEEEFHLRLVPEVALVVPDGVDLERYQDLPQPEEARRQLNLPPGLTAMTSGHLYQGRGAPLFMALAGRFPHIHFIWVGGRAEDVAAWQSQAETAKLSNLRFTGFIANAQMPLYQASADFLLMPYERTVSGSSGGNISSIYSPLKMFEYMAAGRAILSSELPVLHEVLNERNAIFCPPEDPTAWETALQTLIDSPTLRQTLAKQAQQDAGLYSWRLRAQKSLENFLN